MQVAWPTGSPKKRGEWVQVAADWVLFQEMWRRWENVEARGPGQCSRLKPSYQIHLEGLSNFSPSVVELVQIQDVNPKI